MITDVLLKKLTPDELGELCDAFENGKIDVMFYQSLLPRDKENRPYEYTDDTVDCTQ